MRIQNDVLLQLDKVSNEAKKIKQNYYTILSEQYHSIIKELHKLDDELETIMRIGLSLYENKNILSEQIPYCYYAREINDTTYIGIKYSPFYFKISNTLAYNSQYPSITLGLDYHVYDVLRDNLKDDKVITSPQTPVCMTISTSQGIETANIDVTYAVLTESRYDMLNSFIKGFDSYKSEFYKIITEITKKLEISNQSYNKKIQEYYNKDAVSIDEEEHEM